MGFDFAKWKKDSEKKVMNPTLMLLLAGPSGGGKSFTSGTLGVDTLFLHGETESHGKDSIDLGSMKKGKGTVVSRSWVQGNADDSYANLVSILTDPELPKHFGAVVLDGLKDLTFDTIASTSMFFDFCKTPKGDHNSWKEGEAILHLMKPIMSALFKLKASNVHVVCTMVLDINEVGSDGEVLCGKPLLPTYGVAASLIPQFDDRAVVSFVGLKGKGDHYLQFKMDMKRQTSQGTTKIMHIKPKLSGVDFEKLPEYCKADLEVLAKFKKENMLK